jgi:hypothetical protein
MTEPLERQLPSEVIERWQGFLEHSRADADWQAESQRERRLRATVFPQILELLRGYLSGAVSLAEFQSTIDRRSRREWDVLGIKGASGAMFLNKLVKHVPDQPTLDAWLHAALPAPEDRQSGEARMQRFSDALMSLIRSSDVTRGQLQPARTSFLLSAIWHIQDSESWPVYYLSARGVLGREGLLRERPDAGLVRSYFAFRDVWQSLAGTLELDAIGLEHLILWIERHQRSASALPPPPSPLPPLEPAPDLQPATVDENGSAHAHAQWLLAQIGRRLGFKVWIASNDRSKMWRGERLGDLSIANLPAFGAGGATQRTIELIDVLWISGYNQIVAAFEVEHSTSIYSGLLRMSDLAVLAPVVSFPIYIVAPRARLDDVRRQLRRPTFQELELHRRAAFFAIEDLAQHAESIMRFAANATAIDALAERVDDVGDDEGWQ